MSAWDQIHEAESAAEHGDYMASLAFSAISIAKSLATIYDPASTPDAVVAGAEALEGPLRPVVTQVQHLHDPDTP